MERDHHQTPNKQPEKPSSLSLLSPNPKELLTACTDSPRNVAGDRLKRDEWSEGAVSSLLEAYEAKWTLRNRAKLKGQDWEDVAKHVSGRSNGAKSAKTQTQCKNKIESMKKRYRSESAAAADASSWPLYPRLDLLLRGNGVGVVTTAAAVAAASNPPPPPVLTVDLPSLQPIVPPAAAILEVGGGAQNSHGSNGVDRLGKGQDEGEGGANNGEKVGNDEESEKNQPLMDETDSSTAPIDMEKLKRNKGVKKDKWARTKRGREEYWEVGESIRWLAEVVVRSEQARMETMREIERMRAEAEAKRGELDLKRTEIIANTQLQIAKLFARGSSIQEWKNPT